MPVAPSFKDFEVMSDVFKAGGKDYITVKNPKTGTVRTVRWYSDKEYAKAYANKSTKKEENGFDGLKQARGFSKGPILVICGARSKEQLAWCESSCARYANGIGWYIASDFTFPDDAPDGLKYVLLGWDEFKDRDDRHMKSPEDLADIIKRKQQKKEFVDMRAAIRSV